MYIQQYHSQVHCVPSLACVNHITQLCDSVCTMTCYFCSMKRMLLVICLFVTTVCAQAQLKTAIDSVHYLLDTTMAIMQRKALYADKVNWSQLSHELKTQTAAVTTVKEAGFAFTRLFDELKDAHGAFFYKDAVFRSSGKIKNVDKINAVTNKELQKGPKLVATMLPSGIAYVRIPFVSAQDTAGVVAFANRLNDSIVQLLQQKPKGLIIDLRLNQGGNMYPMIAGLRSLYKEGIMSESYTYEHKDKNMTQVFFRNDSLICDYYKIKLLNYRDYSRTKVAVLIGPSTASAGECTAASLTYRQPTVLIGEESMGLTNGNDGFVLVPDEIGFNLAVGVLKNGKGKRLDEVITPDILVEGGDDFTNLAQDAKVMRAAKWMSKRK